MPLPRKRPSRRGQFPIPLFEEGNALKITVGSMADVPENMLEQIKKLEETFTVGKEKLQEITDHFVTELAKGTHCNLRTIY